MCSGMRRTLLKIGLALMLGAPLAGRAMAPAEDAQSRSASVEVAAPVHPFASPDAKLPDALSMVLAGTALIGAAAAVRRTA
jgi:hypothetical protein